MAVSESELGGLTSTEKVVYGREFKIQAWLKAGCTELVMRAETISKEEAIAIDYETTFALFTIREKRLRQYYTSDFATTVIQDVLKEELADIKNFEAEYGQVDVDIESSNTNPPPFGHGNSPPMSIAEEPVVVTSGKMKKKKKGKTTETGIHQIPCFCLGQENPSCQNFY